MSNNLNYVYVQMIFCYYQVWCNMTKNSTIAALLFFLAMPLSTSKMFQSVYHIKYCKYITTFELFDKILIMIHQVNCDDCVKMTVTL